MQVQAPLNIQDYYISELTVRANPAFDKAKSSPAEIPLGVSLDIKDKKEAPCEFMVQLEYWLGTAKNNPPSCPYYISISITGFFQCHRDVDEIKCLNMKHLNAPSILYGIARGLIAQTTASAQHGKFILPSVNFVEILKHNKVTGKNSDRKPNKAGKSKSVADPD